MRNIGAIDIGGTKIAVGIVREDGVLLHRLECPTLPHHGFASALKRIDSLLRQLIDRSGVIAGIGIGCPGPLDPQPGVIGDVGTLPGWEGSRLADEISAATGVSVAVENDADAAALAESAWGANSSAETLIYVTVSTGIGGGLVQGGRLYRGTAGAHPEFGHQLIDPAGPLCYCGLHGCWESLASGTAMSAHFQQIASEHTPLSARQICERARQGDATAAQVVQRTARYLGLGLANLVTLFAPDVVCLGGGVMSSGDLFVEEIRSLLQRTCTQVPVHRTTVTLSSLGRDIGLLGAAQSWLRRTT